MPKGRPNVPGITCRAPFSKRFWHNVKKGNNCWEWMGVKWNNGYGRIIDKGKQLKVHRVMWTIFYKQTLTSKDFILHKCDNPGCVRPNHLFKGNAIINNLDKLLKKRHTFGEKVNTAKLTAAQVRAARKEYTMRRKSYAELARKYGITRQGMRSIIIGEHWKQVQ